VVLLLAVGLTASAQTTTAIVQGKVTDPSGGGIAGATVTVKGTTVRREVTTDAAGFYRAIAMPAGVYSVSAAGTGFNTKVLNGIELFLDRTVTIDISLPIAAQSETMTVVTAAPLVDHTSSSNRQVIDSRTIDAIPLNGRNYLDLVLLTPGVAVNTNARADLPPARDTSGAILGERAGNTSFLIDGVKNNDDVRGGVFQNFSQDAVQEFEVIDSGYKAEFGGGSGGVVNVLTKSGTDQIRGSAFSFYRNDAFDSSPVSGQDPQKLKRYNSGLTLGGPVVRDRAWYFGSFEHFQEKRQSIFPPNIPATLAATEDFSRQPENTNYRVFGKYNQSLNHSNDLRVEGSWTRNEDLNELSSATSLPSASLNNKTTTFLGTAAMNTILTDASLLESSLDYRNQRFAQNQGTADGRSYSVVFLDGGSGFNFGPPIGSVQTLNQKYITLRETYSIFSGEKHAAKAGAELIQTHVDGVQGQGFQYVLATTHPNFALYGREGFQLPQGTGFLSPGDDQIRMRNNGISLFAQDDWRALDKVMLNIGVRYERDSKFKDNNVAPRIGVVWSPDTKTVVRANFGYFYDRYRLGIAEAVPSLGGFNGRTLVEIDYPRLAVDAPAIGGSRALGSIANFLKDPLFINKAFNIPAGTVVTRDNVQQLTGLTPDQFLAKLQTVLAATGRAFNPISFSPVTGYLRQDLSAAFQDAVTAQQPFKTPYNRTFSFGVQRALMPDLSAAVTYVHRDIRDILGVRITNLAFESRNIGAPLTTDGGPLQRTYGPFYSGRYDGEIVSIEKRFHDRYQLQASYTHANATDNLLNANLGLGLGAQGGGAVPTDNLDVNFDRGNSDLSVRHTFVASGVALLPAGFSFSGVMRATSGAFFTASGAPIDYDGDGISSRRPRGTKRNQFTGPSTFNLDLRAEKTFRVSSGWDASLIAEGFNVTNRKNPKLIDSSYVNGAPSATFGSILVPLPGRELQLGARLRF
jgi:hypothetical protein